jgi:hydrogenase maturation protease
MIYAETLLSTTLSGKEALMKTIIVGIGNPILGDDGVGWKIAEEVKKQLPPEANIDVVCLSLGGLGLMERLIGYQRAILIDAFAMKENDEIGSILIMKLSDLPSYSAYHTNSMKNIPLQTAIELGRSMGAQLPEEVDVVGIATEQIHDFSETLSPRVEDAVPFAARIVMDLLGQRTTA